MITAHTVLLVAIVASSHAFLTDQAGSSSGNVAATSSPVDVHSLLSTLASEHAHQFQLMQELVKIVEAAEHDNDGVKSSVELLKGEIRSLRQELLKEGQLSQVLEANQQSLNASVEEELGRQMALEAEIDSLHQISNDTATKMESEEALLAKLQIDMQYFHHKLDLSTASIASIKHKIDTVVMFTAKDSSNTMPSFSDSLRFHSVISNVGNAFDLTSGYFTCPASGMYYFIANIQKTRDHTELSCHVMKNNVELVQPYAEDASQNSNAAGTNAVYVHLATGDRVWVGHCTGGANIRDDTTTFSGALVSLD